MRANAKLGRTEAWRECAAQYAKQCERMCEAAAPSPKAKADLATAVDKVAGFLLERAEASAADIAEALAAAQRAAALSEGKNPQVLATLALAQFKSGNAREAVRTQQKAIGLLPEGKSDPDMSERLSKYEAAVAPDKPK